MEIVQTAVKRTETQTCTVYGEIDTEPIPYGYQAKRRWRPRRIAVTFERNRVTGAPWGPWQDRSASWAGVTVRADGSDGADRSERIYTSLHSSDPGIAEVTAWITSVTPADGEDHS